MRMVCGTLLLGLSLLPLVHAQTKPLPDSCGDDKINFDVKLDKGHPLPARPESGDAQIVFIETLEKAGGCTHCVSTTRIGIDGRWAGADEGDSFFAVSVPPGEHNLCTDVQSKSGRLQLGMGTLTAEAGKTYYYKVKLIWNYLNGTSPYSDLELVPIGADEARYRLRTSALSTATPHS